MNAALEDRLRQLVRHEGRSLLQYVSESFPWTKAHNEGIRDAITRFAREQAEALASLTDHLVKNHVRLPQVSNYPMSFTSMNFVSLSYLLPRLIDEQQARLAELEGLCNALPEGPTRQLVARLLVLKKEHLARMNAIDPAVFAPPIAS